MFKQLPVKKDYLLVAGAVILLLLCYNLAFKGTIEAWQANRELKNRLAQSADLSYQPAYMARKMVNLNKVIAQYRADTMAFRNNSISTISALAEKENVKLSEVPTANPFFHTDKFIIEKLGFEGDYFALTRVLHQLQLTSAIGVVRSAVYRFSGSKTIITDKKLVLEVYLEIAK